VSSLIRAAVEDSWPRDRRALHATREIEQSLGSALFGADHYMRDVLSFQDAIHAGRTSAHLAVELEKVWPKKIAAPSAVRG